MSRRRGQRTGYLHEKSGSWIGEWREDYVDESGNLARKKFAQRIGPAVGKDKLSKRQAQGIFQEVILSKVDAVSLKPQSLMTVQDFVTQKFDLEVVRSMKPAGIKHYDYLLGKHVVPALGARRLRDVTGMEVQKIVTGKMKSGLSTQTATHIKNAISAVFRHAKLTGHFTGDNPASLFRMPEMQRRERSALTFDQARAVVSALASPIREMAFMSMTTSMNVAEMCGLRWRRVNLSDDYVTVDDVVLSPRSVLVAENYYNGRFCSVKTSKRSRKVPLVDEMVGMLKRLRMTTAWGNPEHVVFACSTGRPTSENNACKRILRPLGETLGFRLSWHVFRHAHATMTEELGMLKSDRIAMLGHATGALTDHYTHSDIERRRASLGKLAERIIGEPGRVQ